MTWFIADRPTSRNFNFVTVFIGSRALQKLGDQLDSQAKSLLTKSKSVALSFLRDFYTSPRKGVISLGCDDESGGASVRSGADSVTVAFEAASEALEARQKHIAEVNETLHSKSSATTHEREEAAVSKSFEDWNSV